MASISKTARAILWLLGTILVVGFLLGLVAGVQENKDAIVAQTLADLELVYGPGGVELRHRCGNRYTHAFDVDTGDLRRPNAVREPGPSDLLATLRSQKSLLLSAAGGASGGWTMWRFKDEAFKTRGAARQMLIKGGVALTGYFVGHYAAGKLDASCSSKSTNDFLKEKDSWLNLERLFAAQQLKELGLGNDQWLKGDETFTDRYAARVKALKARAEPGNCKSASSAALSVANALEEVDYNPSSTDFAVIAFSETNCRRLRSFQLEKDQRDYRCGDAVRDRLGLPRTKCNFDDIPPSANPIIKPSPNEPRTSAGDE